MTRLLLEALFLPPASMLLMLLLGSLLKKRWPRTGTTLQVLGFVWLWLLSTPYVAALLIGSLQKIPALPAAGALPAADAIVVLSAECDPVGAEYGGPVVGPMTMQRVRYAAALQRRSGLPVLVSGGVPRAGLPPLAAMMADACKELGVPVKWREERSGDTRENAHWSAELLKAEGKKTVLLVTSAFHMPRAAACFTAEGITVVPAPTGFRSPPLEPALAFVPHWNGLRDTGLALHEWAGRVWYSMSR